MWSWAHILWQCDKLKIEDFAAMETEQRLAYIASHQLESSKPRNLLNAFIKGFIKR